MSSGQSIALTGATGFIGRFLLKDLKRRGYRVRAPLRHPDALVPEIMPIPLPFGGFNAKRSLLSIANLAGAVDALIRAEGSPNRALIAADPTPVALAEIIAAYRNGMGRSPGLFHIPPRIVVRGPFVARKVRTGQASQRIARRRYLGTEIGRLGPGSPYSVRAREIGTQG